MKFSGTLIRLDMDGWLAADAELGRLGADPDWQQPSVEKKSFSIFNHKLKNKLPVLDF